MSRQQLLDAVHNANGRGLSIYMVSGHADDAQFNAAIDGGADWLELGIPFSDPAADGPVIQAAGTASLAAGHRVDDAFALCKRLSARVPIVVMTYANIAYQIGWEEFAKRLQDAGASGLILPDVPLEESEPIRAVLEQHDIAWVPLVTPTTPEARIAEIAATCTGFLYVVGNVGITGQSDPGALVESTVDRVRSVTDLPLAVGFGIASGPDVARIHAAGASAIVGSHIVAKITEGASAAEVQAAVAALSQAQA